MQSIEECNLFVEKEYSKLKLYISILQASATRSQLNIFKKEFYQEYHSDVLRYQISRISIVQIFLFDIEASNYKHAYGFKIFLEHYTVYEKPEKQITAKF